MFPLYLPCFKISLQKKIIMEKHFLDFLTAKTETFCHKTCNTSFLKLIELIYLRLTIKICTLLHFVTINIFNIITTLVPTPGKCAM